jgi:hypothetical protein
MPARGIRDYMQGPPVVGPTQVQRPAPNPVAAPVLPASPPQTVAQRGAPIYNPSGPQPRVMSAGTPVTAPVVAPRPQAGPMPAPVGGAGSIASNMTPVSAPGAPPTAGTGMPPGQLPMARR